MSEAEIKKRLDYKRNRSQLIVVQAIALALAIIVALGSFLIFNNLNQTYYIDYSESGKADYKVGYKENDYFEDEWIGAGQSYVSSLISGISVDFDYVMAMNAADVDFNFTYDVTSEIIISDKSTGHTIYNPKTVLIPETTESLFDVSGLTLSKNVVVDFATYNTEAQEFVKVYGLKNATAQLVVKMNVKVVSSSESFAENNTNNYSLNVNMPLGQDNFSISTGASVPTTENQILAYQGGIDRITFLNTTVASGIVALVLLLILIIFIYATRNEDISYSIKVKKLLRAYGSFIQQMYGDFDTEGYQLVPIKTFDEMLGIRDTIQSPILMSENRDQTKTEFLIPTNTKLLYMFEIKVDNYDEIYWRIDEENSGGEETDDLGDIVAPVPEAEPAPVVDEAPACVEEAPVEEPAPEAQPVDLPSEEGEDDDSIVFYDENENKLLIRCRRSCLANIIQSENEVAKTYYSEIKNYILSRKGVKARMSWKFESFNLGRQQLFKLKIRGKTICLYCALDPNEFDVNKYFHEAVDAKTFEDVPMLIRIKSDRGLARAKKLVDILMERLEVKEDPKFQPVDYVAAHPYERTQELIDRGLIKILIPDGYVVVDPHHVISAKAREEKLALEALERSEAVESGEDGDEIIEYVDENNNKLRIKCRRSCLANIVQSDDDGAKAYYSEIKNYILSRKGVKARMSWKFESFNLGRKQLFKLKIRGKTICLYCALDPNEFDVNKYFHEAVEAKTFQAVPMLIRIKSDRGLARAKKLVDILMERLEVKDNANFKPIDYVKEYPSATAAELIKMGLIKILDN